RFVCLRNCAARPASAVMRAASEWEDSGASHTLRRPGARTGPRTVESLTFFPDFAPNQLRDARVRSSCGRPAPGATRGCRCPGRRGIESVWRGRLRFILDGEVAAMQRKSPAPGSFFSWILTGLTGSAFLFLLALAGVSGCGGSDSDTG